MRRALRKGRSQGLEFGGFVWGKRKECHKQRLEMGTSMTDPCFWRMGSKRCVFGSRERDLR